MEFLENFSDLKGKTILDTRMGKTSNMCIFVTTDKNVMILEYIIADFRDTDFDDAEVHADLYKKGRCEQYLMSNKGTRTWLQKLGVMSKEDAESYESLILAKREKYQAEREQKELVKERESLKLLIKKFPEFAKEIINTED